MRRFLLHAALIGAVVAAFGLLVAASGVIPVTASSGHFEITKAFLRFSMKRSIATHSIGIDVPADLSDPDLVLKGAGHYDLGCRSCHGEPGMASPPISRRMLPQPPDLAPRIRASNPRKLFYVVKHGMKFTGMPAWPSPHRDDEVWAMVAFLLAYPDLDAAGYLSLVGREPAAAPPDAPEAHGAPRGVIAACARCHGHDGVGRGAAFPRLAGQRAEYLRNALHAFAGGRRHGGTMEPVAAALTGEAIDEISAYYAALRPASSARGSAADGDAAAIERGRLVAHEGIVSQRVPACVECHGPGARRGKAAYPSLAGQHAAYLEHQLLLFAEEHRGGSAYAHLMRPVATRLHPDQRRDVSLYFASLPWSDDEAME